jgi:hypothetical protein
VEKIYQNNDSIFEIHIYPKMYGHDGNLYLNVNNPKFHKIYNALIVGETYTFQYELLYEKMAMVICILL